MSRNPTQRREPFWHHGHPHKSPATKCSPKQRSAITQYVAQHLASPSFVIHEVKSELVHVDIHVVPPGPNRAYWFLFTTGMSAESMDVPYDTGLVPHAELSLTLPEYWKVDLAVWKREPHWFWPIREMKAIAQYPHRYGTWIGEGHTLASADPPVPFDPTTELAAMLLTDGRLDDSEPVIDAYVATRLLALWPLHADELEYKLEHGFHALLDRMRAANITAILDPDRESCVTRNHMLH